MLYSSCFTPVERPGATSTEPSVRSSVTPASDDDNCVSEICASEADAPANRSFASTLATAVPPPVFVLPASFTASISPLPAACQRNTPRDGLVSFASAGVTLKLPEMETELCPLPTPAAMGAPLVSVEAVQPDAF